MYPWVCRTALISLTWFDWFAPHRSMTSGKVLTSLQSTLIGHVSYLQSADFKYGYQCSLIFVVIINLKRDFMSWISLGTAAIRWKIAPFSILSVWGFILYPFYQQNVFCCMCKSWFAYGFVRKIRVDNLENSGVRQTWSGNFLWNSTLT